jgi:hypothetical protein
MDPGGQFDYRRRRMTEVLEQSRGGGLVLRPGVKVGPQPKGRRQDGEQHQPEQKPASKCGELT